MIEQTVTIGNLIEATMMLVGGITVFATFRGKVVDLGADVSEMREDIRALNKVVVSMAVTDQRLTALEGDIRDLKHGRGFIREAIDREYSSSR